MSSCDFRDRLAMERFSQRKSQVLGALAQGSDDRSPKGSVDAPIVDLLDAINDHSFYFTTSSCSGRVAICYVSPDRFNRWLLVSHDPIVVDDISKALCQYSPDSDQDSLKIVFEAFILCIECCDLKSASKLWQAAVSAGCRESGIQTNNARNGRIHVSVRCSVRLEVPIADGFAILIDDRYTKHLVDVINHKFALNQAKIDSFSQAFANLSSKPESASRGLSSIVVERCFVDQVVRNLKQMGDGLLDTKSGRRIQALSGSKLAVPISESARERIDEIIELLPFDVELQSDDNEGLIAKTSESPLQRLRRLISALNPPQHLLEKLPTRWEQLGDLILLPSSALTEPEWASIDSAELFGTIAKALSVRRIGRQSAIDPSAKRESHDVVLYGDDGWVRHKENGIIYEFDVTKTMFSSGNGTERKRIGDVVQPGEVIADLFCGIGYFSIPALIHGKASFAYLCEWNENTEAALRRSLKANHIKADRFQIYAGDNREAGLDSVADRVLLGLIPTSEMSWRTALVALKDCGGWLHIHENVAARAEDEFVAGLTAKLDGLISGLPSERKRRWKAAVRHVEIVKSYAPKINHCVFDVFLE